MRDGFIRDADGGAVILRGVNVSPSHKRAPFLDREVDYGFVRDGLGMNSVRFLVEWQAIAPARGEIDQAYLDAVAAEVERATRAELYVIVDMHQDLFGGGFAGGNGAPRWACTEDRYLAFVPRAPWMLGYADENVIACFDAFWRDASLQDEYARAWAAVAKALVKNPRVVGFDPMNEPHWGAFELDAFEARVLPKLYARVIAAVRAQAPSWIAFVEPASSRNLGIATALPVFGEANLVYAPHLYDAGAEQGSGFADDRRSALTANAAALAEEARARGLALWIGEYGGQPKHAGITSYMDAVYDALSPACTGAAYWALGKDDAYGIFDRDGVAKEPLLDAIVRPYPERVAGTPRSCAYDEATRTFTLETTGGAGETVISVPARVYPDGVTCEGCVVKNGRAHVPGSRTTIHIGAP